ncbi:MAG TPA: M28 family peptidase [Terriglobia bacterium]|nr:M28 family peptidase [Terriglobia bacterium]
MNTRRISLLILSVMTAVVSMAAVTPDNLRGHVEWLSAPAREGRRAGLAGAVESAQYIARQFEAMGFRTQTQEFTNNRRNVIARAGTANRYILLGAHYDGQGKGNPSASDNAAGVAVMMELARQLKAENLPVSIVAIAFDDEEQGLQGSIHYVGNPVLPLEDAQAALIFDTFGRPFLDLHSWTLFVLGTESSPELAGVVEKRGQADMLVAGADLIGPRSDFAPFAGKRVPYLFFSHGTHQDYHGPGDTADRVNYARLAQDAGTIANIARDIAGLKQRPSFSAEERYPARETEALNRILTNTRAERPDLPPAYKLMFDDLQQKIHPGAPRETFQMAAAAILALATPRFSPFMLDFELEPYYEKMKRPDIAGAIQAESKKWESFAN